MNNTGSLKDGHFIFGQNAPLQDPDESLPGIFLHEGEEVGIEEEKVVSIRVVDKIRFDHPVQGVFPLKPIHFMSLREGNEGS